MATIQISKALNLDQPRPLLITHGPGWLGPGAWLVLFHQQACNREPWGSNRSRPVQSATAGSCSCSVTRHGCSVAAGAPGCCSVAAAAALSLLPLRRKAPGCGGAPASYAAAARTSTRHALIVPGSPAAAVPSAGRALTAACAAAARADSAAQEPQVQACDE